MSKTTSLVMGGVGGQGIVLASKILAQVIQDHHYQLKVSEIHGMAQRGGSVLTFVRFGAAVHSPLIELGQADYVFALEKLEAWRLLPYLRTGGTMICSSQEIKPMPVIMGRQQYPAQIIPAMQALAAAGQLGALHTFNALEAACDCGQPKAANVALLGVLARTLEFSLASFLAALAAVVPERFLEANQQAFLVGYQG
ncbi:MAG TPA: indolepyruvate oxidoreductase subunit beta [Oscillospiraceae bacterium]|nr:indolepyruvate oxidoreductase subunit beta [Oscillospiraceae bacterium]